MSEVATPTALSVVYNIDLQIKTGDNTWATIDQGFNNLAEALNENVLQYFFLGDKGYARNYVSAMAPAFTLSGVRVFGDPAQDYIFDPARKFGLMQERQTAIKLVETLADGSTDTIECEATLCNITSIGGASTDGSAVSVEIRCDGKPKATHAAKPTG